MYSKLQNKFNLIGNRLFEFNKFFHSLLKYFLSFRFLKSYTPFFRSEEVKIKSFSAVVKIWATTDFIEILKIPLCTSLFFKLRLVDSEFLN